MDKIAIISDVHGNMPALEAVLANVRERGIEVIYNLGDLVGKGARSDLAVDCCREMCQVIVKGNWDDVLVHTDKAFPDRPWYQAQLGGERLAYLDSLPNSYDFWLSGKRVRLYHASAQHLYHRVYPWDNAEVHQAMFDNTPFIGEEGSLPHIVGYGDIHAAFMLPVSSNIGPDRLLFNAGSVGNSLDLPLATYTILGGQLDSQAPSAFSIDFVRLTYDVEQEIANARAVGLPELDYYAVELREGIYRGRQKRMQQDT